MKQKETQQKSTPTARPSGILLDVIARTSNVLRFFVVGRIPSASLIRGLGCRLGEIINSP